MTQTDKKCFRDSKAWKEFRKRLGNERKVDEVTNKPLRSGWNLHHLCQDESEYDNISDESRFACLNKASHEAVHFFYRYYVKDPSIIERLVNILERMRE